MMAAMEAARLALFAAALGQAAAKVSQ